MTVGLPTLPMKLLGQRAPTLLDALLFDAWYRLEHAVFTKAIHHKQALGLSAHRERRLLQNLTAMPKLAYVAEIRLRAVERALSRRVGLTRRHSRPHTMSA